MRRHRAVVVLAALIAGAMILALLVDEIVLTRRVAALEAIAAERNAADPLFPAECRHGTRMRDVPGGQTRDNPCNVSFQRLLDAPQQFVGRWVEVQGRYVSGFETSALFPPKSEPPADSPWEPTDHALWVNVEPFAPPDARGGAVFIGRFRRGPTGHLGMYFAALDSQ